MAIADDELAVREQSGMQWARDPRRIDMRINGLVCTDAHAADFTVSCSAIVADTVADRTLAEEVLMAGRDRLTAADLAIHLSTPVGGMLERRLATLAYSDLQDATTRQQVLGLVQDEAARAAFACGIELLPPWSMHTASVSHQRATREQADRQRARERATATIQQLDRSIELLERFQAMRSTTSGVSAGAALSQLASMDQADALSALLKAEAAKAPPPTLWLASGGSLVKVELSDDAPPRSTVIPLPPDLGPLRSVTAAGHSGETANGGSVRLLVGARGGVWVISPDDMESAKALRCDAPGGETGFNSAAMVGGRVLASHSSLGVVRWSMESLARAVGPDVTETPRTATTPAGEPVLAGRCGHLLPLDGSRCLCSRDNTVVLLGAQEPILKLGPGVSVVSILDAGPEVAVVASDGSLWRIERRTLRPIESNRRGGSLNGGGGLPWLGERRVLLASADGPVICVGVDDGLVTQYDAPAAGWRDAEAAIGWVAAVADDRNRVLLWRSWDGRQPAAQVHVTGMTRHRIADLCFA